MEVKTTAVGTVSTETKFRKIACNPSVITTCTHDGDTHALDMFKENSNPATRLIDAEASINNNSSCKLTYFFPNKNRSDCGNQNAIARQKPPNNMEIPTYRQYRFKTSLLFFKTEKRGIKISENTDCAMMNNAEMRPNAPSWATPAEFPKYPNNRIFN